jgi:GH25 family lysozyme M1 (1,4-beta-N-acetylmuramidase)
MHGKALRLPGFTDGIDISQVQRIDDANAIREAGFEFAVCKASEGIGYSDPRVREHLAKLDGAGIHAGVYGFARVEFGRAREQALRAIEAAGDTHRVRVALDMESCPKGYKSRPIVDFCIEWCATVEAEGAMPVFYTMPGFWLGVVNHAPAPGLAKYPLWIAQYRSTSEPWAPQLVDAAKPRTVAPWDACRVWQYSGDKGYRVPGIAQDCDRNLFRGDSAALRDWFGLPPVGSVDERSGVHGMFGVSPYDV